MTIHKINGDTYLLIPTETGASNFEIDTWAFNDQPFIAYELDGMQLNEDLPKGNWQLIGLSDEINEDLMTAFVKHFKPYASFAYSAREWFDAILSSHGITKAVLLKKN